MSEPLSVALVWHMHQPYYREDGSGRFLLPWVRRRASKDYVRMIETAMRHPGLRITMNFVPTLLEQLDLYARGEGDDSHRELCLRPAAELTPGERDFLVRFTRSTDFPRRVAMFEPFYRLLTTLPADGSAVADASIRDLQVWSQLVWIDPSDIAQDDELNALVRRGGHFREVDKPVVDEHQLARVRDVLPRLREAIASGCIEPMTSPFAHPILPLLIDQESAQVARPDLRLPQPHLRFRRPGDAADQIERGFAVFERVCGHRPAGMWPSECAVSPAAAASIAAGGGLWAVSDEGVLAKSLGASVRGDEMERLYAPYREQSGLVLVFRDAQLSNRIGFDYPSMRARDALADLIQRLEDIAAAQPADPPWLVVIALDGENCWDYYEDNGAEFIDGLYSRLVDSARLKTVHVGDFINRHPGSVRPLDRLWSGSWIDADFSTWIGEDAHTRAWELLAETRRAVDAAGGAAAHPQAYRQVLIAEGSDWFWWFGSRHQSGVDAAWDALFRTHLRRAYELIGQAAATELDDAILSGVEAPGDVAPLRAIDPIGAGDPEWRAAGVLHVAGVFGAMQPPRSSLERIRYGASASHLHLMIGDGAASLDSAELSLDGADGLYLAGSSASTAVALPDAGDARFSLRLREAGRGEERVPSAGRVTVRRLERSPAVIVAAECAPLAVVGGLAAAVRATVDALLDLGRTCIVILPHHRVVHGRVTAERLEQPVTLGGQTRAVRVRQGSLENGAIVLTLDEPSLFDREAIYGQDDDVARYVFFARAAVDVLDATSLRPSTVQGFEWQTSVTVALLAQTEPRVAATIFSAGEARVHQAAPPELLAGAGLRVTGGAPVDLLELGEACAEFVSDFRGRGLDGVYRAAAAAAVSRR